MATNFNIAYGDRNIKDKESDLYNSYIHGDSKLFAEISIHGLWRSVILSALKDIYSNTLYCVRSSKQPFPLLTNCRENIRNSIIPFFNIFLNHDFSVLTNNDMQMIKDFEYEKSSEVLQQDGGTQQITFGFTPVTQSVHKSIMKSLLANFTCLLGSGLGLIYMSYLAISNSGNFAHFIKKMQNSISNIAQAYLLLEIPKQDFQGYETFSLGKQ